MELFTIKNGNVVSGAIVGKLHLKGAGIDIPAIIIGEEGRGRQLGVLPVKLMSEQLSEWKEKGETTIYFAEVGKTKAGKPKLFTKNNAGSEKNFLVVFLTHIGFRGRNNHTGDRTGEIKNDNPVFAEFPGEILVQGRIAQGDAGRAGSGKQIVAIMPKKTVFRTSYYGRLYGAPPSHYYLYDDGKILSLTWEERTASDLF